jgi:hypothetical protein
VGGGERKEKKINKKRKEKETKKWHRKERKKISEGVFWFFVVLHLASWFSTGKKGSFDWEQNDAV